MGWFFWACDGMLNIEASNQCTIWDFRSRDLVVDNLIETAGALVKGLNRKFGFFCGHCFEQPSSWYQQENREMKVMLEWILISIITDSRDIWYVYRYITNGNVYKELLLGVLMIFIWFDSMNQGNPFIQLFFQWFGWLVLIWCCNWGIFMILSLQ